MNTTTQLEFTALLPPPGPLPLLLMSRLIARLRAAGCEFALSLSLLAEWCAAAIDRHRRYAAAVRAIDDPIERNGELFAACLRNDPPAIRHRAEAALAEVQRRTTACATAMDISGEE